MPTKLQTYSELAEVTAKQLTDSTENWTSFLTTAARLYKYPYHEQLMIYAQRPDATACADFETWNKRMGRYVRRGSTGIALIDTNGDTPKLRYVFDVADTGAREKSRELNLWAYTPEHAEAVQDMLTESFFPHSGDLFSHIEAVSANLAAEYWHDHSYDIGGILADSFLEEYNIDTLEYRFRSMAALGTTYSILSRCGINPDLYIDGEDFRPIFEFNTPDTIAALGTAVSDMSEIVLREIERTVKNYERIHEHEEERTDLHESGRLQPPEPDLAESAAAGTRQIREDAPEISEEPPSDPVQSADPVGEAVLSPDGDRGNSEPSDGADDGRADESERSDGTDEIGESDALGADDEQSESAGRGNDSERADLQLSEPEPYIPIRGEQLTLFDDVSFLTETEQITYIDQAESVKPTPFAFSMEQVEIDTVLRYGGNERDSRMRIAVEFMKDKSVEDHAVFLQNLFHGGNGFKVDNREICAWYAEDGIHLAPGRSARYEKSAQIVPWTDAAVRINELLEQGQFASNVELAEAAGNERRLLAQQLVYMQRDIREDVRPNYFAEAMFTGAFDDARDRIAEMLADPFMRDTITDELARFAEDRAADHSILRFSYYKTDEMVQNFRELALMNREFSSEIAEIPQTEQFITEDEIDELFASHGSGYTEGKLRIYGYFTTDHTKMEKVDFLKNEYGTGGHSPALSGATFSDEWHDSKGIQLKKQNCYDVQISWQNAVKRIDDLIRKDRYLTPTEKQAHTALHTAGDVYNTVKHDHPDDIVLYQVGDFFEMYGEDAKAASEKLDIYLTDRNIPNVGRVEMCGIPSHRLEQYVEKLREDFSVTICVDADGQRNVYSLGKLESEIPMVEEAIPEPEIIPAPRTEMTQEEIDDALRYFGEDIDRKVMIAEYMLEHGREKDTAAWLSQAYHGDSDTSKPMHFTIPNTDIDVVWSWAKVQRRVAQLVSADEFFTDNERLILQQRSEIAADESHDTESQKIYTTPEGISYRAGDTFTAVIDGNIVSAVIDRVENDYVWYTLSDMPEQAPVEILQGRFDAHLDDGLFTIGTAEQTVAHDDVEKDAALNIPPYKIGNTVYLDDTAFEITEIGDFNVQLRDPTLEYPIFRSESRTMFEQMLRLDSRNGAITEFLSAELEITDSDLQEVLVGDGGLLDSHEKEMISRWFLAGEGNTAISHKMSEAYAGTVEMMNLVGGEDADYRATTFGLEIEIQDKYSTSFSFSWREIVPILRAMYEQERDGFTQHLIQREPVLLEGVPNYKIGDSVVIPYHDREIKGTIGYIGDINVRIDTTPYSWSNETINRELFEEYLRRDERNTNLFLFEKETTPLQFSTETETIYPAEENHLPYDIVIERLKTDDTPPPENFRITDDNLGIGGAKAKFRMNMDAIHTLKLIEAENRHATPKEQEILSKYIGWGGLADAFDDSKDNWKSEYAELTDALTPEEYAAARSSTLNAHYTSPTVIKAIYEAVGNMGFTTGNVLEPSMGVGNFFGLLPQEMSGSKLYGVELDSITGRIAKQLYPNADITVAGFETTDRRDFFDLAVGNVPFGQYKVNDKAYNKLNFSIHDYFFAKTLDQVRPGGVIAFITSRYTMDKESPEVRKYIAERADLLGAIRLPNNAFKANAGTEVVSDILFLQKRDHPQVIEPDWVHLGQNEDGFAINSYFIDHPEMILGRQSSESTQYGKQDFTVEPIEGLELADQLHDAIKYIRGTYVEAELPDLGENEAIDTSIPADPNVKNYSYTVVDGEVYYRENSRMVKPNLNATAQERVKGMVELRDCVQNLIDQQLNGGTNEEIVQSQAQLNQFYDDYTAKYGLINDRANRAAFADDSSYYLLCSLEILDEEQKLKRKADMFTKRTIKQNTVATSVDTAAEALALSISEKARVDMPYMSQLTGKSAEDLASELRGVIFRLPESPQTFVTADEYLSGNVREKLAVAESYAETNPDFSVNVEALRAAQPKDLDASEIEVRLGATWIDKSYIRQFMIELLDPPFYLRRKIDVNYSEFTAEWNISGKSVDSSNINSFYTYGTDRASAYRILEDTLNLRDVRIYDTVTDSDGKERRVLNAKETTLAQQKQQAIKDAFQEWIWKTPDRRHALVQKYNELFNSTRPREYNGEHITFNGINPEISLREHQKNAVAHILYGGNTLLAHEVGAGKTFEMVAAAMESKRLGLCNKPLFAVPNHLTEQWASEFLRLYPSANILVTTKKDFEPANRKKFCARIATGNYDAIIMGHSQFEKIPMSKERQEQLLRSQIEEITDGIAELQASNAERFTIKQLERTRKSLEARLSKLQDDSRKDDVITFEQLGVDRLYVDEAHNYKNLFLYTKMRNVAGLSTTDAQKSSDMFMKCRYLDEITGSKGVVFATGTPVSNSMTELYTMMRYLQHDTLDKKHLNHFDAWASTFGETTTAIELAPEGTGYRARTRFAKFFNLPELMNLFKEAADIKTSDQLHLPVPDATYHNVVAKPTEVQEALVQELSERASKVHAGVVDPSVDNMLKITSDGRKLGLDQRIINPDLPDDPMSKVNLCVDNIFQIWEDGKAGRLTQLVFSDLSTPKTRSSTDKIAAKSAVDADVHGIVEAVDREIPDESSFTVYEDIRDKLISRGVPREEIAFIHDADTEVKKKELFAKVRSGHVRVLIGSTSKMGAGTNCQDRLVALHDLDCPWRPGDLEQRKGRIIRQGNQNKEVHIYRYVTEATFDAYLWQTIENKQKFISQIMTSKSPVRACDDIDEATLSYAEVKALCAGDPRIKEKMDLDVEVAKLKLLKSNHQSQQFRMQDDIMKHYPEKIEYYRHVIAGLETDKQTVESRPHPADGFAGMDVKSDFLTDKDNAGAAILEACKDAKGLEPVPIGSYRGFAMSITVEDFGRQYILTLKGELSHRVELGKDARGNLIRIDNVLNQIPARIQAAQAQLENVQNQLETAKAEVNKPFPQEEELRTKSARLHELNAELNIDERSSMERAADDIVAKSEKPSVLGKLKSIQPQVSSNSVKKKTHEEVL